MQPQQTLFPPSNNTPHRHIQHPPAGRLLFLFPAPLPGPAFYPHRRSADEYRSSEDDDADNEATIEEEEALTAAEGRNIKVGG